MMFLIYLGSTNIFLNHNIAMKIEFKPTRKGKFEVTVEKW